MNNTAQPDSWDVALNMHTRVHAILQQMKQENNLTVVRFAELIEVEAIQIVDTQAIVENKARGLGGSPLP